MSPDFLRPTLLFGGSFDPVHEGHLHLARLARRQLPSSPQLVFVPAGESPGKGRSRAGAELRLRWLRLAAEPEGFFVWDWELQRPGPSYSFETLEEAHRLGAERQRLFWLLGGDAYSRFPTWKNPSRIRELCRLVVFDRPGQQVASLHEADLFLEGEAHPASSSEIRAQLAAGRPAPWLPQAVRADLEILLPRVNPYATKTE